ncbi:MAG: tyrosine-protein phosphatase, partial [Clostridia bacterium]|nr:tyrosine-protein phosphatase [Clostridia bacterium]
MKKAMIFCFACLMFTALCACGAASGTKEREKHTLTFTFDGETLGESEVVYGENTGAFPTLAEKTGYDVCWTIDGEEFKENSVYNYHEDKTAAAGYVAKKFTLVFENASSKRVVYGTEIGDMPEVPHREGYFGWWELEDEKITSSTVYDRLSGGTVAAVYVHVGNIVLNALGEGVYINNEHIRAYYEDDYDSFAEYAGFASEERGKPVPVVLSWAVDVDEGQELTGYIVSVDTNKDFSTQKTYATTETSLALKNLYMGERYYWKVKGLCVSGYEITGETSTFTTEYGARTIDIKGITNVRDTGGYYTGDATRIKQGMIYRGARLNNNDKTEVEPFISEEEIRYMKEELGIKTEIDLRRNSAMDSNEVGGLVSGKDGVLGAGVKYVQCPMYDGTSLDNDSNKASIANVFNILADEKNYPVYIHCSIGTDRTGIVCFFINALLGADEETLYRDYLLSTFGAIGVTRGPGTITSYINNVNIYFDYTFTERAKSYLMGRFGISEKKLDKIISIMTENVAEKDGFELKTVSTGSGIFTETAKGDVDVLCGVDPDKAELRFDAYFDETYLGNYSGVHGFETGLMVAPKDLLRSDFILGNECVKKVGFSGGGSQG